MKKVLTQLERKIIAKFGKQGDKEIRKIIKNLAINALKTGKIKNLL